VLVIRHALLRTANAKACARALPPVAAEDEKAAKVLVPIRSNTIETGRNNPLVRAVQTAEIVASAVWQELRMARLGTSRRKAARHVNNELSEALPTTVAIVLHDRTGAVRQLGSHRCARVFHPLEEWRACLINSRSKCRLPGEIGRLLKPPRFRSVRRGRQLQ